MRSVALAQASPSVRAHCLAPAELCSSPRAHTAALPRPPPTLGRAELCPAARPTPSQRRPRAPLLCRVRPPRSDDSDSDGPGDESGCRASESARAREPCNRPPAVDGGYRQREAPAPALHGGRGRGLRQPTRRAKYGGSSRAGRLPSGVRRQALKYGGSRQGLRVRLGWPGCPAAGRNWRLKAGLKGHPSVKRPAAVGP